MKKEESLLYGTVPSELNEHTVIAVLNTGT